MKIASELIVTKRLTAIDFFSDEVTMEDKQRQAMTTTDKTKKQHQGRADSKEEHSSESLKNYISEIRRLIEPAVSLAGDPDKPDEPGFIDGLGFGTVEISFEKSYLRAVEELSRWSEACAAAYIRKCQELKINPIDPYGNRGKPK